METLYNGIQLPEQWPPANIDPSSREPIRVPYLERPPEVVPIDTGRQLFVDDFLIEHTELRRNIHRAEAYADNPVLTAVTEDELLHRGTCRFGHGGLVFDPRDKLFKMFYTAGWRGGLALATSTDGLHWERPQLGLHRDNLLLLPGDEQAGKESCVWLDLEAENPAERYKLMIHRGAGRHTMHVSPDASDLSEGIRTPTRVGDNCCFFYNPFRKVWVYSIKKEEDNGRCRYYAESKQFLQFQEQWENAVFWANADRLDEPDPRVGQPAQLYSLNAVAYESLLVGAFQIHRGPDNGICERGEFPKLTDLSLGFSRDGFHWHRPERRPFLAGTRQEGDWNRGYLASLAGVFMTGRDRLIFPFTGFSGIAPDGSRGMYHGASIGLAFLRRDGFASMDAGSSGGSLTTRPVRFNGKHLFVNVDCPLGELRAEVLREDGRVIAPYTAENCEPVSADSTIREIRWRGADDLSALAGQPVRLRFHLNGGALYAFWVSPDSSGASCGYVAAGGSAYAGPIDTTGRGGGRA